MATLGWIRPRRLEHKRQMTRGIRIYEGEKYQSGEEHGTNVGIVFPTLAPQYNQYLSSTSLVASSPIHCCARTMLGLILFAR